MSKLPRGLKPKEVVKAFNNIGYYIDHQTGSHIILYNENVEMPMLSIPNHKYVKVGLLRKLIRDAGLTVDEFTKLL